MNWTVKSGVALAAVFLVAANGAELKLETKQEWGDYLVQANARMTDRIQCHFLWVDESEQRLKRVRAGEIVVAPIQPKMPIAVRHGLVHDWVGAAFIPGVRIEDVITTVREYDRYVEFYAPEIAGVQPIERSVNPEQARDRFSLTIVNKSFFSKRGLECESVSNYVRLDEHRWYSQSRDVRIQEWAQYGTSRQYKLPEGKGTGYIWGVSSISRFEERDGGVYVEMEAIALSRDVPVELRMVAYPIIKKVSQSALVTSLDQTRKAVKERATIAKIDYKERQK